MEEVFPVIFFINILESADGSEAVFFIIFFSPFTGLQDQNMWVTFFLSCFFALLQGYRIKMYKEPGDKSKPSILSRMPLGLFRGFELGLHQYFLVQSLRFKKGPLRS